MVKLDLYLPHSTHAPLNSDLVKNLRNGLLIHVNLPNTRCMYIAGTKCVFNTEIHVFYVCRRQKRGRVHANLPNPQCNGFVKRAVYTGKPP